MFSVAILVMDAPCCGISCMLKRAPSVLRNRTFPKTTTCRSPQFEYKMNQVAEESGELV